MQGRRCRRARVAGAEVAVQVSQAFLPAGVQASVVSLQPVQLAGELLPVLVLEELVPDGVALLQRLLALPHLLRAHVVDALRCSNHPPREGVLGLLHTIGHVAKRAFFSSRRDENANVRAALAKRSGGVGFPRGSSGLVVHVITAPVSTAVLKAFSVANIQMSQNPVPYNPTITATQFVFNKMPGPGWGSWALTSAALTGFNYDSDWCFVLKVRRTQNLADNWKVAIGFDPVVSSWSSNDGFADGNNAALVPKFVAIAPGSETNKVINFANTWVVVSSSPTPGNALDAGLYINLSYVNSSKTPKVEYTSVAGVVLYSETTTYTFANKQTPFLFYSDGAQYTFDKGIFFDSSGYAPYSSYSSFFA